ncbi:MAG: molybdate ABC transporter substrate-binding protein [Desulfovibrio sp.]|nr:molybdate ABC transporter substrate-binding protein [Desulfovibrio sp.]
MIRILALLVFVLSASAGLAAELTVSAAASLANAFDEMKQAFEKRYPGITVNTNYAASNPLLRQIAAGAPVDVFASADEATMDKAENEKVVDPATRRQFAMNDLVLIVPRGSAPVKGLQDLVNLGHIAIGNPASVPAGRYARDSLVNAGLWDKLEHKLILGSSVRQTLDYVARGEVDAGIVYGTDARQLKDKVEVVQVMDGHEPVTYPVAVCLTGANQDAAHDFIKFVLSPEGQEILAKYGFAKP